MALHEQIRAYIQNNLVVFDEQAKFSDSDNIFELGFVNSLFAMKLLTHIEGTYHITVDNDELDLANFASVNNIVALIERKRAEVEA